MFGWDRDQITGGGSHAHGVDFNTVRLCRRLCRFESTALQILAICHQDQYFIACGTSSQGGLPGLDGGRYIRTAARNRVGIDGAQRLMEGPIVERDRTGQKGGAGKCHDPHRIAIQFLGEIIDRQLSAGEPIGLHIGCQHAARGVDRENDVVAAAAHHFPVESHLRTGERNEQANQRAEEQAALQAPPADRYRPGQLIAQVWRYELGKRCALARVIAAPQPNERKRRQQPCRQPRGVGEVHGSLRSRVCCSSRLSPRMPKAGISAQGYNSSVCSNFCTVCAVFSKRLISSYIFCKELVSVAR